MSIPSAVKTIKPTAIKMRQTGYKEIIKQIGVEEVA